MAVELLCDEMLAAVQCELAGYSLLGPRAARGLAERHPPDARRAEACVKARANADFRAHRYALAIEGYSEVLAVLDDVRAQRRGRRRLAAARARGAARLA
jgi:hypothetical protein